MADAVGARGARPRVMGIDPGLTRCGVAVVDDLGSRRARLVHVTVVRTDADTQLAWRLLRLEQQLEPLVERYQPDEMSIERVFAQHNTISAMDTAMAAATASLLASRRAIPVSWHTPSEAKAAVTGSGTAGKEQVATMVTRILGLAEVPRPADAADAVAQALCHLWRGPAAPGSVPGAVARDTPTSLTPAQRSWVEAQRAAVRRGRRR